MKDVGSMVVNMRPKIKYSAHPVHVQRLTLPVDDHVTISLVPTPRAHAPWHSCSDWICLLISNCAWRFGRPADDEVVFEDFRTKTPSAMTEYAKVWHCAKQARAAGLE